MTVTFKPGNELFVKGPKNRKGKRQTAAFSAVKKGLGRNRAYRREYSLRQPDGDGMRDGDAARCPTAAATASPTLLVVDDEVLLRMLIADELRQQKYTVIEAANADDALDLLLSGVTVNLLVTDVRMPGRVDGTGLATAVKNLWPEMKIVIASAHASQVQIDAADAVFSKPYDVEKLILTVKALLSAGATGQAIGE